MQVTGPDRLSLPSPKKTLVKFGNWLQEFVFQESLQEMPGFIFHWMAR